MQQKIENSLKSHISVQEGLTASSHRVEVKMSFRLGKIDTPEVISPDEVHRKFMKMHGFTDEDIEMLDALNTIDCSAEALEKRWK